MCSCCDCDCGYAIASTLYLSQRLALCCAAASIALCLLITLVITGGVGVGVGYHYCVVETKSYDLDLEQFRHKYTSAPTKPAPATTALETTTVPETTTAPANPYDESSNKRDATYRVRSIISDRATQLQLPNQRSDYKVQITHLGQNNKTRIVTKNLRKEYERTTWLYKENPDINFYHRIKKKPKLYKSQSSQNKTQIKQQGTFDSEKL